jgi:hypothetical protein
VRLLILVLCLIGVMPNEADIEVRWLGLLAHAVKIAEIAMPHDIEAFVQKASLKDQRLFPVDHVLIDNALRCVETQIILAESGRRKNNLTGQLGRFGLAPGQEIKDSFCGFPAVIFFISLGKTVEGMDKINSGFPSGICIFYQDVDGLSDLNSVSNAGVTRADPCPRCCNHTLTADLSGFAHAVGLLVARLGLFSCGGRLLGGDFGQITIGFDKFIGLRGSAFHFIELLAENVSLIENASGRSDDKYQRQIFSKSLAAILATFFIAIGLALLTYGVYQSREIGGWAALIVIFSIPFFFAGTVFLLSGVLRWDGGLSSGWGF